jgi:glycosyltransferase involved in cell wall biosynthesis
VRLGIYLDGPYRIVQTADGPRIAPDPADLPFLGFVYEVSRSFDELRLFVRTKPYEQSEQPSLLPADVEFSALPDFGDLRRLGRVLRSSFGTVRGFRQGLRRVDAVWAFGPHPFGLVLILMALFSRKRAVIGVRQDTVSYFRSRVPGGRWRPALAFISVLDGAYRVAARFVATTVVGGEIYRRYGGPRRSLLEFTVCLVRAEDVVHEPHEREWSGQLELLAVGRIDREKNPRLLIEALAELERQHPGRYRLALIGTGPLEESVRRHADELGVADLVEMTGFMRFGKQLLNRYRTAHILVHVSLTEGVPAVLFEAMASGLPIVATDVGGVRDALDHGRAGLLVPPDDLRALVTAILSISDDNQRGELVARGLDLARLHTLEREAARVARFIRIDAGAEAH